MKTLLVVFLLVLVAPVHCEEATPFQWATHQQVPARISDAALGVNLGLDAWQSFYKTDARARWGFACRLGLTMGIAELTKRLVHRERPNGSDAMSFFSEHTALATTAAHSSLSASLAVTVGWGRMSGGKHFASDVAVGAGVGLFTRKVCP